MKSPNGASNGREDRDRPGRARPGANGNGRLAPQAGGPPTDEADDAADGSAPVLTQTPLTPEELESFRALLISKRRELGGDVSRMSAEALGSNRQDASGDLSKVPMHMADVGTDNYEQEFTLGLIQNQQQILAEIDAALARIDAGTYGICEATRRPISRARLRAQPWARFCIAHVRRLEEQQGRPKKRWA
ncbi:MAG: TraR/DksA C4-type zinc finger protein [Phycisphaerae bacterium]|nr:TraR/DksA C4-type zinc finger protein [Phycisphaerae bacterium]